MNEEGSQARSISPYIPALESLSRLSDSEILYGKAAHILSATNTIRSGIANGEMDGLSAEEAFHRIHILHIGNTPEAHLLALSNLGLASEQQRGGYRTDLKDVYELVVGDRSQSAGVYRTEDYTEWGPERGLFGIEVEDLKPFAKEVFAFANGLTVSPGIYIEPTPAFGMAVGLATLIDIAHFKRDGNGRSQEDWYVWFQRKLGIKDPKAISTNGLREPGLQAIINPRYQMAYESQRLKIVARDKLVSGIRRSMFEAVAVKLGVEADELGWKIFMLNNKKYRPQSRSELTRILNVGTEVLRDCLQDLRGNRYYDSSFSELMRYMEQNGSSDFDFFDPAEVLVQI